MHTCICTHLHAHGQADGLKQAAECEELRARVSSLLLELSDATKRHSTTESALHAAQSELRVAEATAHEWRHAAQRYAAPIALNAYARLSASTALHCHASLFE